jgi:hypothetical protein
MRRRGPGAFFRRRQACARGRQRSVGDSEVAPTETRIPAGSSAVSAACDADPDLPALLASARPACTRPRRVATGACPATRRPRLARRPLVPRGHAACPPSAPSPTRTARPRSGAGPRARERWRSAPTRASSCSPPEMAASSRDAARPPPATTMSRSGRRSSAGSVLALPARRSGAPLPDRQRFRAPPRDGLDSGRAARRGDL